MVGRRIEDLRCKKYLEGRERDVVGERRERRNSRSLFRQTFVLISVDQSKMSAMSLPVCRHLFEPHFEENLSELMAHFVHCAQI